MTNFSTSPYDLDRFANDWSTVATFLQDHQLDGLELIFYGDYPLATIPKQLIEGVHLRYWPTWLDFWRRNRSELLRQFGTEETIIQAYGGLQPETLVEHYQQEMAKAKELDARYVVFHVSHVQMDHIFTRAFTYGDQEVLDAAIELINAAFGSRDQEITLLLENLWWPGLTLLDPSQVRRFLDAITYPNKGIMLDIGHLMLTHSELRTEQEACHYILRIIDQLGELQDYIRGVHLNKALLGGDTPALSSKPENFDNLDPTAQFLAARSHILRLDQHKPFDHPAIQEVMAAVNPAYVVYELLTPDKQQLQQAIHSQNVALGRA